MENLIFLAIGFVLGGFFGGIAIFLKISSKNRDMIVELTRAQESKNWAEQRLEMLKKEIDSLRENSFIAFKNFANEMMESSKKIGRAHV